MVTPRPPLQMFQYDFGVATIFLSCELVNLNLTQIFYLLYINNTRLCLAAPGCSWHLTFALRQLGNLTFFKEILCWAPWISQQHAKKVWSNSPGLADLLSGQWKSVLNLPNGQLLFLGKIQLQKEICNQSC